PQWAAHRPWQRELLKGKWRAGMSWTAMGVEAGFHPVFIDELYSYLCGYAHASWLSVVQLRDAGTLAQQAGMVERSMSSVLVLMAFFVHHYVALFPEAASVLAAQPEGARLAERWHLNAARMAERYPDA
ncbi:MAG TPA: hypothetical protein VGD21_08920, partial [Lysobacter sp.]